MKKFCKYCRREVDFRLYTETKLSSQKQAWVCPICRHPIEWKVRRINNGEVTDEWQDETSQRLSKERGL